MPLWADFARTWRFSSVQIKVKSSINGHPGDTEGKVQGFTCRWGSIIASCDSAPTNTPDLFPGRKPRVMNDYANPVPAGESAVTRTAAHGEPDMSSPEWCTAHLLCPLAWGSCCGWPGCVVFEEQASSSFSCWTSSAKCCSKSLFCSSSWWTRAWASIRAAVSAAIWSFNSCTWSRNNGQGVFVCVQTFLSWLICKT